MARGFVWAIYVDDLGASWAMRVDADYAADADRGWITEGVEGLLPLPRMWRPRFVIGIDEEGREQRAIAATLAAAIWQGQVSTFIFTANDGFIRAADIVGRRAERSIRPG